MTFKILNKSILLLIVINISFPFSTPRKYVDCKWSNEYVEEYCAKKYKDDNNKIGECIEKENEKIDLFNQQLEEKVVELKNGINEQIHIIEKGNPSNGILYYFEPYRYNHYNRDSIHIYLQNILNKDISSIECYDTLNNIYQFLSNRNNSINLYHLAQFLLKTQAPQITLEELKKLKKVDIFPHGNLIDTTDGEIFLAFYHLIPLMQNTPDYMVFSENFKQNSLLRFFSFIHENNEKILEANDEILKNATNMLISLNDSEIEIIFKWSNFYYEKVSNIRKGIFQSFRKFKKSYELESTKNNKAGKNSLSKYRDVMSKDRINKLYNIFKKHDKIKPNFYKYLERLNDPEKEYLRQKNYKEKKGTKK